MVAEANTVSTKFITTTAKGTRLLSQVTMEFSEGRIWFLKSPFSLKDEIKAMKDSKWHGNDDEPRKIWSVADCQRNRFQIEYLEDKDVYGWFDKQLVEQTFTRPLLDHQKELVTILMTYHYGIVAGEPGIGKTLIGQEVIERSGHNHWWWAGPKVSLENMKREFRIWGFDFDKIEVEFMTYEEMTKRQKEWKPGNRLPQGLMADESSRLKNGSSQRTKSAQFFADLIRDTYGYEGFAIELSGTPAPKSPLDWHSQAEIAWPGFLKEGDTKRLESRLAFMVEQVIGDDRKVWVRRGWKDDENKCSKCGRFESEHEADKDDYHKWEPSVNEVSYLYERLKGLVTVKLKKDCLSLPDKFYRVIQCPPTEATKRVAKALLNSAPNAMTGLTLVRELSDGFQYREEEDGLMKCPHCAEGQVEEWFDPRDEERIFQTIEFLNAERCAELTKRLVPCPMCGGSAEVAKKIRTEREVPCPKDAALKNLLEECEETGRIVIFAGFTGSVNRCVKLCQSQGWNVVRCDGRGFVVFKTNSDGSITQLDDVKPLDYWANLDNEKVAFVAHPESGGMSLTLTQSSMAVFYSNTYKSEFRTQAEDRVHRIGADSNRGVTIVDLVHLSTDEKVLETLKENRKLELLTLGELAQAL